MKHMFHRKTNKCEEGKCIIGFDMHSFLSCDGVLVKSIDMKKFISDVGAKFKFKFCPNCSKDIEWGSEK